MNSTPVRFKRKFLTQLHFDGHGPNNAGSRSLGHNVQSRALISSAAGLKSRSRDRLRFERRRADQKAVCTATVLPGRSTGAGLHYLKAIPAMRVVRSRDAS